jgi:hypothetical protein
LHVAKTQQPFYKTSSVKCLEVLKVLACAKEDDRTLGGCDCAEGATTLGMAVKFRDDN